MMPSSCDGCGSVFSLSHAMDCRKGGLVTQHHNKVRDALGDLAAFAYKDVIREPVVCEGNAEVPALVADLGIRGVWLPQTEALLDIQVTDADAPSYLTRSVGNVLAMAEEEKTKVCISRGTTPLEISYACPEIKGNHDRNHWKSGNQASRQKSQFVTKFFLKYM